MGIKIIEWVSPPKQKKQTKQNDRIIRMDHGDGMGQLWNQCDI
jgi:hypothetical protein